MEEIFLILLSISLLFFVLLGVKEFLNKKRKNKFCVICAAVILTWILFLIFYWIGFFENKTIIALLIGQSILGIFYLWEKMVKEKTKVFRLPLLLTLIVIAYSLLEGFNYSFFVIILLIFLWALFLLIHIFKDKGKMGVFVRKIVECCKKW